MRCSAARVASVQGALGPCSGGGSVAGGLADMGRDAAGAARCCFWMCASSAPCRVKRSPFCAALTGWPRPYAPIRRLGRRVCRNAGRGGHMDETCRLLADRTQDGGVCGGGCVRKAWQTAPGLDGLPFSMWSPPERGGDALLRWTVCVCGRCRGPGRLQLWVWLAVVAKGVEPGDANEESGGHRATIARTKDDSTVVAATVARGVRPVVREAHPTQRGLKGGRDPTFSVIEFDACARGLHSSVRFADAHRSHAVVCRSWRLGYGYRACAPCPQFDRTVVARRGDCNGVAPLARCVSQCLSLGGLPVSV